MRTLAYFSVFLSLAACGSTTIPSSADAGDDGADGGAATPDGAVAAANVDEAFGDCTHPGEAGGLASGTALMRVDIDPVAFPEAQCSDGTTPLFFVRKATNPTHANKWVLLLQGGGACSSPEGCAKRWCSVDTNFGANKMSNRYAPESGMVGKGILTNRADNHFNGWNQVFLYYCTSDQWSGTQASVTMEAPHPVAGGDAVSYRMSFAGSRVFDAVVGTLRDSVTYTDDGGAAVTMPDLDDATEVVLAGASAGGGGVVNNIDRLAETLRANNNACGGASCPLEVSAIIDSSYGSDLHSLDIAPTPMCTEMGFCTTESFLTDAWNRRQTYWAMRGDESCVEWNDSRATGDTYLCAYGNFVVENHITTPFFLRMGLRDSLVSSNHIDAGFTVPSFGGVALDLTIFAQLVSSQLQALPNITSTANEASEITVAPGVFGPPCPKHETLRSGPDTYDVTVGSPARRFLELFGNWRAGTAPSMAVVSSGTEPFTCP